MCQVTVNYCKDFDLKSKYTKKFASSDLVSTVQKVMVEDFEIPDDVNVRTWLYAVSNEARLLDPDKTLMEEQILKSPLLVLETQKPDGSWRRAFEKNTLRTEPKIMGRLGPTKPGLCGLSNLGNTCFMNSTLQCLSHCPPLAEYFLNNNYLNDLKPDGGLEVELCRAFGELLKAMWSGENTDVPPTSFKWKVGRYAAQFVGYQQHDAQEFLTFLLDGLHEAINRAKKNSKPPPAETNNVDSDSEKQVDKSDQELASETWENYLRKSDSIIVRTFHGLLKSSVVCPVCETVSVKFDPLCYMTLPLPQDSDCVLKVLHVPYDQSKKAVVYRITVSKFGTVRDVIAKIAERVDESPELFILAEIVNCHFHKFFSLNDSVDKIDSVGTNLVVYDVPLILNNGTVIPVCHWEVPDTDCAGQSGASSLSYSSASMFGIPFIIVLPNTPITYKNLSILIYQKIERYISKQKELFSGNNMNTDSENEFNAIDDLFTIYIVNGQNPTEAKKIPNDGSLLKFPECLGKQFLALQWTVKSRKEFYKCDPYLSQDLLNPQVKVKLLLEDCIGIFMSTEKLGANDTWNCPKCKVSRRATKKFDLWQLPNVLIILLKRFTFNRGDSMGRGMFLDSSSLYCWEDKLNATVEFPMTNFRLNNYLINKDHPPVSYDLCGVINHYGTLSGGHYTAYAKHKEDKKWYCFDDSRVYPQSEENVMSSSAYILFYMQNNYNTKQK